MPLDIRMNVSSPWKHPPRKGTSWCPRTTLISDSFRRGKAHLQSIQKSSASSKSVTSLKAQTKQSSRNSGSSKSAPFCQSTSTKMPRTSGISGRMAPDRRENSSSSRGTTRSMKPSTPATRSSMPACIPTTAASCLPASSCSGSSPF